MKKLGLCVRYDCNNFGSMLQIMATQKLISEMGWNYEIIRYNKKNVKFILKNCTRIFNPYFMSGKIMDFSKKQKLKKYPEVNEGNNRRLDLFAKYRNQYIGPYSVVYKGYDELVKNSTKYDAFVVGSDQLWTPAGIKSKFYNLLFVPDNIKKVSFATSFGVSEIPKNQVTQTANYLKRIEYLSVREQKGKEIIKKLTNRDATIALDPTLMYDGADWENIFPNMKIIQEPYIFAYFLGTNIEHRKCVERYAKEKNLKIITCPHMDYFVEYDLAFGDEQRFDIGPVEFLNLIRNAEYIATDSFHGTVFSILNHKKFVTFNRYAEGKESRNSRIDSLFNLLGLENQRYNTNSDNLDEKINFKIDYNIVDKKLIELRKESYSFLENALK